MKSRALLFFFTFFCFSCIPAHLSQDFLYNICGDRNYTAGGTFGANLGRLLSSLSAKGGRSDGYYDDTVGDVATTPDAVVYGLVLCMGNVDKVTCAECLKTAAQDVMQKCPNSTEAVIWYDHCWLRYSDTYFFSKVSLATVIMWNVNNISKEELQDVDPRDMMDDLQKITPTKPLMYLPEIKTVGSSATRYAMAQCSRDLNSSGCHDCLSGLEIYYTSYCEGKRGWRLLTASCMMRYEDYNFLTGVVPTPQPSSSPPPPPPPILAGNNSDLAKTRRDGRRTQRLAISVLAPTIAVLSLFFGYLCYKKSRKGTTSGGSRSSQNPMDDHLDPPIRDYFSSVEDDRWSAEESQELPLINLETILAATDNFSSDNKLGEGGFGPVYKGILPQSGKQIAVKRLSAKSSQGQQEFMNEVRLIARLQHRNLVRLLFCCMEKEERLLVYEYMPNGSLDAVIFDPIKRAELDWEQRFNIIYGVARGLMYLHSDSRLKVIHRDLKAGNILLDENMFPKISDFGMARIFAGDQNQSNTNRLVGTFGYMAPEYAMEGLFSDKSDVFSFGVLLLEIISGMKNSRFYMSPEFGQSLTQCAWQLWCAGKALDLTDHLMQRIYPSEKMLRYIQIGLLCVQEDAEDRPDMLTVVTMLSSESMHLPSPTKPAFSVGRGVLELVQTSSATAKFQCSDELTVSTTPLPR